MTLNDEAFAEASQALARRMLSLEKTRDEQISLGVLLATGREVEASELQQLRQLHQTTLQTLATRKRSGSADASHLAEAALTNVANVLLNLDEVLCK